MGERDSGELTAPEPPPPPHPDKPQTVGVSFQKPSVTVHLLPVQPEA